MSATKMVPSLVPFVFHNSVPCSPSSAEKYNSPLNSVKYLGSLPPVPRLISLSITTEPASGLRSQSSLPNSPLSAVKIIWSSFKAVNSVGRELPEPRLISLNNPKDIVEQRVVLVSISPDSRLPLAEIPSPSPLSKP